MKFEKAQSGLYLASYRGPRWCPYWPGQKGGLRFGTGPTLVAHGTAGGNTGATTSGLNTTGANFLIIGLGYFPGNTITISDSVNGGAGNTWTALTAYAGTLAAQMWYVQNPTNVGANHTFSFSATGAVYGNMAAEAWSSMATSGVFQTGTDNGTNSGGTEVTTLQVGSITPSGPTIVFSCIGYGDTTGETLSMNDSFTLADHVAMGSQQGMGLAYLIQTSGSAINPTWSFGGSITEWCGAGIAAFTYSAPSFQPDEDFWQDLKVTARGVDAGNPNVTVFS